MPPPYTTPPTRRRRAPRIPPQELADVGVLQSLVTFVKQQNSRFIAAPSPPLTIARVTMWLLDKTSDVDQLNRVYNLALACDAIRERDGNITTGDPKWRLGKNES